MKVLWFTNTPSLYDQGNHIYHGCGWIESLEHILEQQQDIELAIAFFHSEDDQKQIRDRTTYYPIRRPAGRKHPFKLLKNNWFGNLTDEGDSSTIRNIVDDFKPDIIHVFGTEGPFTRIQENTDVPVVIHLQGLVNPSLNTYFPVGSSEVDFLTSREFLAKNILCSGPAFDAKRFAKQAERERITLERSRYVMGRTQWDSQIAKLYNPNVNYFHVNEMLRPAFYGTGRPKKRRTKPLSIISTLSPTVYKGVDIVLRTAKQLKTFNQVNFRWQIAGLADDDRLLRHYERKEGICHREVGINCLGRKGPEDLVKLLQQCDVFVHSSYIDNSPNSVCEAQMLGLPVIASNVGGISSLIEHNKTGLLVPANGVFETVHYLHALADDRSFSERIGINAAELSEDRHNRDKIIHELKAAYKAVIKE